MPPLPDSTTPEHLTTPPSGNRHPFLSFPHASASTSSPVAHGVPVPPAGFSPFFFSRSPSAPTPTHDPPPGLADDECFDYRPTQADDGVADDLAAVFATFSVSAPDDEYAILDAHREYNDRHGGAPLSPSSSAFDNTGCAVESAPSDADEPPPPPPRRPYGDVLVTFRPPRAPAHPPSIPSHSDAFTIVSVNARGLNDRSKLSKLLGWSRRARHDVVLLQETKWNASEFPLPEHDHGGLHWNKPASLSCSRQGNASGGTAIFVAHPMSGRGFTTSDAVGGERFGGHFCGILLTLPSRRRIYIGSVYAPASDRQQRGPFFLRLQEHLSEIEERLRPDQIVLGGDWNCVLNPSLDRSRELVHGEMGQRELNDMLASANLTDAFRTLNPTLRAYTHDAAGVRSRLDRFYMTKVGQSSVEHAHVTGLGYAFDHQAVVLRFTETATGARGPFKLNTSLLKRAGFKQTIVDLLLNFRRAHETPSSVYDAWGTLKGKIRDAFKEEGRRQASFRTSRRATLLARLQTATDTLDADPRDPMRQAARTAALDALEAYDAFDADGAAIRTHCEWLRDGERSSRLFLNLESRLGPRTRLTRLEGEDGTVHTTPAALAECYRAYIAKTLAVRKKTNAALRREFLHHMPRIQHDDALPESASDDDGPRQPFLDDTSFSMEEVAGLLPSLPKDRSPGLDGIPYSFWTELADVGAGLLADVFNESLLRGRPPVSMRTGVVTTVPKKGKKATAPEGHRPITLLCTDYKILAHLVRRRVVGHCVDVIHRDQTGFIPGRDIHSNIIMLRAFLANTHDALRDGAAILLDDRSAYDLVQHDCLHEVVEHCRFPPLVAKAIHALYAEFSLRVKVHTHIGTPFKQLAGLHQGCPLSPLLYNLVSEPLLCRLRRDIRGVRIEGEHRLAVSAYADDKVLFLRNTGDGMRARAALTDYCAAFGAEINWGKCELIPLVAESRATWTRFFPDIDVRPAGTPTRYLGATVCRPAGQTAYQSCVNKVLEVIDDVWKPVAPMTTPLGRVTILNTMANSRLTHALTTEVVTPDDNKHAKDLARRFVFQLSGKAATPYPAEFLYCLREKGGLGVLDVRVAAQTGGTRVLATNANDRTSASGALFRLLVHNADQRLGRPPGGDCELTLRANDDLVLWARDCVDIWRSPAVGGQISTADVTFSHPRKEFQPASKMSASRMSHRIRLEWKGPASRDSHRYMKHQHRTRADEPRLATGVIPPGTNPSDTDAPTAEAWKAITARVRTPKERHLSYMVGHRSRPVGERVKHNTNKDRPENSEFCSTCPGKIPETFDHAFIECPAARRVWDRFDNIARRLPRAPELAPLPAQFSVRDRLFDGLYQRMGAYRSPILLFYLMLQAFTLSVIWNTRTRIRFRKQQPSVEAAVAIFDAGWPARLELASHAHRDMDRFISEHLFQPP